MLLVPGAIIALIGAHLYLVVKLGTTAPPWLKADAEAEVAGDAGANGTVTASGDGAAATHEAAEKEATSANTSC